MPRLTFDDLLGGQRLSFEDVIAGRGHRYSFKELLQQTMPLTPEERRLKMERRYGETAKYLDVLEQLGRGLMSTATLGTSKYIIGEQHPTTTVGAAARGLGEFAGFLVPLKAAGATVGKATAKYVPKMFRGVRAGKAIEELPKLAGIGARFGQKALPIVPTMAAAEAISDITKPQETLERLWQGTKVGAVFAAAGMAGVSKYPLLNWILRQGSGRALMKLSGQAYQEGYWSKENLPGAVLNEALHTWILSHGTSVNEILTGKAPDRVMRQVKMLDKELRDFNIEQDQLEKMEISAGHFRQQKLKMNLNDIYTNPVNIELNKQQIPTWKKRLRKGIKYNVELYWNEARGKYEARDQAALVESYRHIFQEKKLRGDEFDPSVNVIIREPSPHKQRGRLPKLMHILAQFQAENVTPDTIRRIEGLTSIMYNVESKKFTPMTGEAILPIKKPGRFEIRFDLVDDIWQPIEYGWGTKRMKGKERDLTKISEEANRIMEEVKGVPGKMIPSSYLQDLDIRSERLGIGLRDAEPIFELLELPKKMRTLSELGNIEELFHNLEYVAPHNRIRVLMDRFRGRYGYIEDKVSENMRELYEIQEVENKNMESIRRRAYAKAVSEASKGGGDVNVLTQLLTIPGMGRWADVRYSFMKLQENTGIPFWDIHKSLSAGSAEKNTRLFEITKPLNKFNKMPIEDIAAVREYYAKQYAGYDMALSEAALTPRQREYISSINDLMNSIAPEVRFYRFKLWYDNVYLKPPGDKSLDLKVFRNQEAIKDKLNSLAQDYVYNVEMGKIRGIDAEVEGIRAFNKIMDMDKVTQRLGLVEEGVYLPEYILKNDIRNLSAKDIIHYVDGVGHSHVNQRGTIQTKKSIVDLAESAVDAVRGQDLNVQIHQYVNQVLNLTHLEPHLRALNAVSRLFGGQMERAKPRAFGRGSVEAKGTSTLDLIKLYAHRMKGFPVKMGAFSKTLRGIQSWFFRTLTVNPFLWLRNLFQGYATVPMKSMVLDPRYMYKKFTDLPDNIQEMFDTRGVNQFESFKHHYLFLEATESVKKVPIFGQFMDAAERVGTTYALTDKFNRARVFTKTWFKSRNIMSNHFNGNISATGMERKLALHRLKPLEQRRIRSLLSRGEVDRATFEYAEWMVDNSQWKYRRQDKSLSEMTAEGEAMTNLLTWAKGIGQQTYNAFDNIFTQAHRASEYKVGSKQWFRHINNAVNSGVQIAGVFVAGSVAEELLSHASIKHGAKYRSYSWDMFAWEFGGMSAEILKSVAEQFGNVITSFDGTPDEKRTAMGEFIKTFDNMALRQMLPFTKQALAIVESITGRSYISPFYDKYKSWIDGYNSQAKVVKRTTAEAIIHALLGKDPNKSEYVRRYTDFKRQDFRRLYLDEKNPWLKFYYKRMYDRFTYFSNIFMRYEPRLAWKYRQDREWTKWKNGRDKEELYRRAYVGRKTTRQ